MEDFVEQVSSSVVAQIEDAFPWAPFVKQRVAALASFKTRDYMAGPEGVRELFLNELREFADYLVRAEDDEEDVPLDDWRELFMAGQYLDFHARDDLYVLTTRGMDALDNGKLSPVEERIIELLCAAVRADVWVAIDGGVKKGRGRPRIKTAHKAATDDILGV